MTAFAKTEIDVARGPQGTAGTHIHLGPEARSIDVSIPGKEPVSEEGPLNGSETGEGLWTDAHRISDGAVQATGTSGVLVEVVGSISIETTKTVVTKASHHQGTPGRGRPPEITQGR